MLMNNETRPLEHVYLLCYLAVRQKFNLLCIPLYVSHKTDFLHVLEVFLRTCYRSDLLHVSLVLLH